MMKIMLKALGGLVLGVFLSGCTVSETTYSPGYNSDFVYSVGYYGYRPYWGDPYSSTYITRDVGWYTTRPYYFGNSRLGM